MLASPTAEDNPDTLLEALKRRIAREGPLTIAQYMDACLCDPEHGYYATRDPFGSGGDFITAPEISQIFGELIGLWCAVLWQQMGAPAPFALVEMGPGRGTLMADALRAGARVNGFIEAAQLHLVETSPVLRRLQKEQLADTGKTPHWHDLLDEVPDGPAILIANEFLDALPVRQFERREGKWFERCVGVSGQGGLEYCSAAKSLNTNKILPRPIRDTARDGDMAEIRPGADAIVETIAARAQTSPIAALFIDYGHERSAPGETLQAIKTHDFADPLARPGEADLTAHVDFAQLGHVAGEKGLQVHGPLPQGEFLLALGLEERCDRLMGDADDEAAKTISSGARRLVDPARMGELFKVMALTSEHLTPPPFDGAQAPEQDI
jgi:NADH dehydrogenase [ubiquinone] 1 alpha subcomplex assembly factor 7